MIELRGKGRRRGKDGKQWSGGDLKLAGEGRLERGCHHFLSACEKEVLQGSGEASLFRGETTTFDNRFMILGILLHLGMNGSRQKMLCYLYFSNRLILRRLVVM